MSYAICLRFNNSNLDTKCTSLAVCRAALQIFGSNSPSAENEGQPVYVQYRHDVRHDVQRFEGGNHTDSWKAAQIILYD